MNPASERGISAEKAYELAASQCSWRDMEDFIVSGGYLPFSKVISYVKNIFIPVTTLCRNRCGYCGFVHSDSRVEGNILSPGEVIHLLRSGAGLKCKEALFVLGEQPEESAPELKKLLESWGYRDMVHYLEFLCEKALEMGLLPHTNAGILGHDELFRLQRVNASMGLMLESSSLRLCRPGGPHQFSPGKVPALRLQYIEEAGKMGIPFTTGILVGIGETPEERVDALLELRKLHRTYGHIQEIIIQNFCPKEGTPMAKSPEPTLEELLKTVALCRLIFGPDMNIQVPPNLNPQSYFMFLRAGANDWGGVSPLTKDMINPEKPWPSIDEMRENTLKMGFVPRERLSVYPGFPKRRYIHPLINEIILENVDTKGYVIEVENNG